MAQAVGGGGNVINYLPRTRSGVMQPGGTPSGAPVHFPVQALSSPWAQQIQALAAQIGGGQSQSNPLQDFVPPAPKLPPGTYAGPYAAQGLRSTNPMQAAQLWESRHPGQVHAGNVPGWVTQGLMSGMPHPGNQMDPHEVLQDVVSAHRQANGLEPMHPEELHARVTNLAHEILGSRHNRLRRAMRSIVPPSPVPPQAPSGPVGGPFQAS